MAKWTIKPGNTQPSTSKNNQEQGWGGYALRNVAKAPAQLYSTVRSGLGLGYLAKVASEEQRAPRNKLEALNQQANKRALRYLLPSPEQATEEAQSFYSNFSSPETAKYLTESKPGDIGAELALQEIPLAYATGGLSSIPAALKYGTRLVGILGGSKLGSYVGSALGQLAKMPKTGEALGSVGGGIVGGTLAHGARPTKKLLPHILEEEASAANIARELEESHPLLIQEFEEAKAARIAAVQEEFKPKIAEAKAKHKMTRKELAAERDAFEKKKAEKIAAIDKKILDLDKNIETVLEGRKPNYSQASLHKETNPVPTQTINEAINEAQYDTGGVSASEQSLILKALNDVEDVTRSGTAPLGKLEGLQKNINGQISAAKRNGHPNVVRHLSRISEKLKDLIIEHGNEELVESWLKGEEATVKASQLKKQKPVTKAELETERSRIKAEKYSEADKLAAKELLEESKSRITELTKKQKDIIDSIGKEQYESFVKNKETPPNVQNLIKEFEKGKKKGIYSNLGWGMLSAGLGYLAAGIPTSFFGGAKGIGTALKRAGQNAFNVAKYEKAIFDYAKEHHHGLWKEYMDTLTSVTKQNIPRSVMRLNDISKKMADKYPKNRKTTTRKWTIKPS